MARINVEESLFNDPRFDQLTEETGSKFTALGMLVFAWRLSQQYHLKNDGMIPVEIWQRAQFGAALLRAGFAKQVENSVYVCGSKEQFNWLTQRSEAGKIVTEKKKEHLQRARDAKSNKKDLVYTESIRDLNGSIPLSLPLPLSLKKENTNTCTVVEKSTPVLAPSKQIIKFENLEELCNSLPDHKIEQWTDLYPNEIFLQRELKKAFYWYKDNPKKEPRSMRGWCGAISSWYERSWRHERKIIAVNKPNQTYMGIVPK